MTKDLVEQVTFYEPTPGLSMDEEFQRMLADAEIEESAYMLPKGYLSPSQVDMYLRCGKQYEYRYCQNNFQPPGIAMLEGSAVHRGLEIGLREKMAGHDVKVDMMLDAWRDKWVESKKQVEDWGDEGEEVNADIVESRSVGMLKLYHHEHLPQANPVGVEKSFTAVLGENRIPVMGVIDLIHSINDKVNCVIDHKVVKRAKSQTEADHSLQLTLYSIAEKTEAVQFNSFVKTKTPQVKVIQSFRGERDHAWAVHVYEMVAAGIKAGLFLPADPSSYVCSPKYCGYYAMCRGKKS